MAELTIDPTAIRKALDDFVEAYRPSDTPTQEVGYVATAGDGIAHVTGLPGCMANELLTFEDGTLGLAMNLDAREIGVVILGDFAGIEEGQEVRRTGEVLSVPVGKGLLGRVVNPLGEPIDGKGPIQFTERRRVDVKAPMASSRAIGSRADADGHEGDRHPDPGRPRPARAHHRRPPDRQDGHRHRHDHQPEGQLSTSRRPSQARCAASMSPSARKRSTVASDAPEPRGIRRDGIHHRSWPATASDSAGCKYIAPVHRFCHRPALDVSRDKHVPHRLSTICPRKLKRIVQMSLLLRSPPGREAYPGDVFYLHSRLLERCAKLSDDLGGGSMTGLPIIETKANDVSAYIPTNVISITDGQIFLQSDLFIRPISVRRSNVGISVSRVGSLGPDQGLEEGLRHD
jgi:F-type H+-transporting ATPase subunit alpha